MYNIENYQIPPFVSFKCPSTMFLCLDDSLPASTTPKYIGLKGAVCETEQCPYGCLEPGGCSILLKLQHSNINMSIFLLCSTMDHVVAEGT